MSDLAASKRHSSFGTELRKARSLEVGIDLVDVVHELTLQVVPHRGLMLYKSESVEKIHIDGESLSHTVQLARPLHGVVGHGDLHARLKAESYIWHEFSEASVREACSAYRACPQRRELAPVRPRWLP